MTIAPTQTAELTVTMIHAARAERQKLEAEIARLTALARAAYAEEAAQVQHLAGVDFGAAAQEMAALRPSETSPLWDDYKSL